jgi:hypothetical protein
MGEGYNTNMAFLERKSGQKIAQKANLAVSKGLIFSLNAYFSVCISFLIKYITIHLN